VEGVDWSGSAVRVVAELSKWACNNNNNNEMQKDIRCIDKQLLVLITK
jgi:hypothetical protein